MTKRLAGGARAAVCEVSVTSPPVAANAATIDLQASVHIDSDDATITRGFFAALPAVLAARTDVAGLASGALAIVVEGVGSWTISDRGVTDGADLSARAVVAFAASTFAALLRGTTGDPSHARDTVRDVAYAATVIGDARALEDLGHLLAGPQRGGIGARLANHSPPSSRRPDSRSPRR